MTMLDNIIAKLKDQLDWIGPTGKTMGHVVLERTVGLHALCYLLAAKARRDNSQMALSPIEQALGWNNDVAAAPRDGTTISVPVERVLQVYWCKDLETWVTTREITINSIANPKRWRA